MTPIQLDTFLSRRNLDVQRKRDRNPKERPSKDTVGRQFSAGQGKRSQRKANLPTPDLGLGVPLLFVDLRRLFCSGIRRLIHSPERKIKKSVCSKAPTKRGVESDFKLHFN